MSGEDINGQVGKALREYSEAKAALAHSDELLVSVADQHEKVASVLRSSAGKNFTSPDRMIMAMGAQDLGTRIRLYLEDGERLTTILGEHEAARKRVASALSSLRAFGFGNVE